MVYVLYRSQMKLNGWSTSILVSRIIYAHEPGQNCAIFLKGSRSKGSKTDLSTSQVLHTVHEENKIIVR